MFTVSTSVLCLRHIDVDFVYDVHMVAFSNAVRSAISETAGLLDQIPTQRGDKNINHIKCSSIVILALVIKRPSSGLIRVVGVAAGIT